MQFDDNSSRKYIFVCGLHRSGTSLLAENIGKLENCTGFKGVPPSVSDEGQNLQDIYPFEAEYRGPGRFGFDPRAHLTESSKLLTAENVMRLRASWHSYWDNGKAIFVEKTPGNLLMTRFLQAAFPNSYFVVITRHPIPVSMGTPKLGQASAISLHRLFEHWLHCNELFEQDRKYLQRVYELKYEDYIEDPAKYHNELAAFLGTRVPEGGLKEVKAAPSKKYFDRWFNLLTSSFFNSYYRFIAAKYEPRFAKYGYSLTELSGTNGDVLCETGKVNAALGSLYCLGADAYALILRLLSWPPPYLRRRIKARLPESVLVRINQARQKASLSKDRGEVSST